MSDFLAFLSVQSLAVGPLLIIVAFILVPMLETDPTSDSSQRLTQIVFGSIGIVETVVGPTLLMTRLRKVKGIFAHGIEVKSKVVARAPDRGNATFEYSIMGRPFRSSKHVFGRQTLPDLGVGNEVDLVVNEQMPERFVIREQYL